MEQFESVTKLTKDMRAAAATLSDAEARFLVDAYYAMQRDRMGQHRSAEQAEERGEPNTVLQWLGTQSETLENQIKGALDKYSGAHEVGRWMRSIKGIGPVIAAGYLAHIDIRLCPTVGHIWRFAGLDPTQTWDKGKRRPWNARLKTLAWKTGQSFVMVSGGDEPSPYGVIYRERKAYEVARNEAGELAEQAAAKLKRFKIGMDTKARGIYEAGKLPPAHLDMRAQRYATKLFLSHLHQVWYEIEFGTASAKPFAISMLGHAHYIPPPNWPMVQP